MECSLNFRSDLNRSSGSQNSEPKFSESLMTVGGDSGQEFNTFENVLWSGQFAGAWVFDGPVSAVVWLLGDDDIFFFEVPKSLASF